MCALGQIGSEADGADFLTPVEASLLDGIRARPISVSGAEDTSSLGRSHAHRPPLWGSCGQSLALECPPPEVSQGWP